MSGENSVYFDGTDDFIYYSGQSDFSFSSGDFTIELWFYILSFTGTHSLIDFRPTATQGFYPTLYLSTSANNLRYYTNAADRITGGTISVNRWYHVALSKFSSNTRLFLDGTQVGTTYADTNTYLVGVNNRPRVAISGLDNTLDFKGYISNLRILKGTGLYTSNFTKPSAPLTAIANTVLLTLQDEKTYKDFSINDIKPSVEGTVNYSPRNPFIANTIESGIISSEDFDSVRTDPREVGYWRDFNLRPFVR
jgi:hypothetical protein